MKKTQVLIAAFLIVFVGLLAACTEEQISEAESTASSVAGEVADDVAANQDSGGDSGSSDSSGGDSGSSDNSGDSGKSGGDSGNSGDSGGNSGSGDSGSNNSGSSDSGSSDSSSDSNDGGLSGLVYILIGLGMLTLVLVAFGVGSGGRRRQAAPAPAQPQANPQAAAQRHASDVIAATDWYHDTLSMEVMADSPSDAQQRLRQNQARLDDVSVGLRQLTEENGQRSDLVSLEQAYGSSVRSLQTFIELRNKPGADQSLVDQAGQEAQQGRAELASAIANVRAAQ